MGSTGGCWESGLLGLRERDAESSDSWGWERELRRDFPSIPVFLVFQYSCLENSMDGGAWGATVHRITKSQTQLSNFSLP